jgi:hypothetical protein
VPCLPCPHAPATSSGSRVPVAPPATFDASVSPPTAPSAASINSTVVPLALRGYISLAAVFTNPLIVYI